MTANDDTRFVANDPYSGNNAVEGVEKWGLSNYTNFFRRKSRAFEYTGQKSARVKRGRRSGSRVYDRGNQ